MPVTQFQSFLGQLEESAQQETWVHSLGQKTLLEKDMQPTQHSCLGELHGQRIWC